jgi:Sulfotransferase domain
LTQDPNAAVQPVATQRRTGDRLANLLLAGVGRAGTTSLFWYLSQHSEICASSKKEPRYFLELSEADEGVSGVLPPIEEYERCFEQCSNERYRMEATPGYFHGGPRLVGGIQAMLDAPRIVITLRDPIARIWSIYRYAKSHLLLPAQVTFGEYVERCRKLDREGGLRPHREQAYWSIRASHYVDYLGPWLDTFGKDVRVVFFEDLVASPREVVEGLCAWLGIDRGPVASFDLSVENKSIRYRSRALQRVALAVNSEGFFRRHRRLKAGLRRIYFRLNDRGGRESMPEPVRRQLELMFAEPNRRLADLLAVRGYVDLPPWLGSTLSSRTG